MERLGTERHIVLGFETKTLRKRGNTLRLQGLVRSLGARRLDGVRSLKVLRKRRVQITRAVTGELAELTHTRGATGIRARSRRAEGRHTHGAETGRQVRRHHLLGHVRISIPIYYFLRKI